MTCIIDESRNVTANFSLYLSTATSGPLLFFEAEKNVVEAQQRLGFAALKSPIKVYFLRAEFKEWVVIYQVSLSKASYGFIKCLGLNRQHLLECYVIVHFTVL